MASKGYGQGRGARGEGGLCDVRIAGKLHGRTVGIERAFFFPFFGTCGDYGEGPWVGQAVEYEGRRKGKLRNTRVVLLD